LTTELRGAFDGIEATTIHDGNDEVEIMAKYDKASRSSLSTVNEMHFASPAGMVPFTNLGHLERHRGFARIFRYDQERSIDILADVAEGQTTSRAVVRKMIDHFADIPQQFPGYRVQFGGEYEKTQESLQSMLKALFVASILIYVILGGLFQSFIQPLVVMLSVPFGFIGVVFGFFLLDEPLGLFSIVGIFGLTGIVVNDSLIFIDFINRQRRAGIAPDEAIIKAGGARLRPILLTSITTIAGLLPMSWGFFGVDPLLKPMAMAIAWGLLFSTALTLVVIPCMYRIFDDVSLLVRGRALSITEDDSVFQHGAQDTSLEVLA